MKRLHLLFVLFLAAFSVAPGVRAQNTVLFTFETGTYPIGVPIVGPDGNLHGATSQGGNNAFGTVYRLTPTGALTTLVSFSGINGTTPNAKMVLGNDGNFYGTTESGNFDGGTIFCLTPTGVLTTLYKFLNSNSNIRPSALTLGPDGNFYGTLRAGGATTNGSIFRCTPTGVMTTMTEFAYTTTGNAPVAPLLLGRDGNFYGTATSGGSKYSGTLFRVTPAGKITVLKEFDFSVTGAPGNSALVEDANGNLYGIVPGHPNFPGGIFRLTPTGDFTMPVRFTANYGSDAQPTLSAGADGNLYGTTPGESGSDGGSIFRLTPAGAFTVLARFTDAQGFRPTGLSLAPDGSFYGAATYHGAGGLGTVFHFTVAGELTAICAFSRNGGASPYGGLLLAPDGNFYGAAYEGGPNGMGLIFRVTPDGVRTTLAAFGGKNPGRYPRGRLCLDANGNLLGTTSVGGDNGFGTAFRLTLDGILTTLCHFGASKNGVIGYEPEAGLVPGPDGAFYGTTAGGGSNTLGTVYRLTSEGVLTTLHVFNGADGRNPFAELTVGPDNALYGTTQYGGANGLGTVFRTTTTGDFKTLVNFDNSTGGNPQAPLTLAGDGNFYGAVVNGGPGTGYRSGAVFRVTPAGVLTPLGVFNGVNGANPRGGLALGADGHLYGATFAGGGYNAGVLFRLTTAGELTALRAFDGAVQGSGPQSTPVFGANGMLYGTANHVLWRLPVSAAGETWRLRFFNTAVNAGSAADDADPDGDGITNLLERAFGLDPRMGNATNLFTPTRDSSGHLLLTAARGVDAPDLICTAEASADLQTWSAADVTVLTNNAVLFQARDDGPATGRRFMRLRITRP